MEKQLILKHIDHTLLKQDITWVQVKEVCKEAIEFQTASVCIPPSFVAQAKAFVQNQMVICTVIGFPNGYQTTATKVFETQEAVASGADEIDMVVNIGWVKEGNYEGVKAEIERVKDACQGKLLKVIIETSLLTKDEKIQMCHVVSASTADYIKTSTGFAGGGATLEDIQLFHELVSPKGTKIKAAGGIKSVRDAEDFLQAGAQRLGSSSLLGMIRSES